MSGEYVYGMEETAEMLSDALAVTAVSNLLGLAVGIATYVLMAVAFYTMAKRRGIRHAWLSWIPIGNVWILGSLADQYRYVARGQVKNKRKALLILNLVMTVCFVIFMVCGILFVVNMIQVEALGFSEDQVLGGIAGPVMGMLGLSLPVLGMSIALFIIQYMAIYDVFMSSDPEHAVLFLVLGILISPTLPIFMFVSRKKDRGMVRMIPQNPYGPSYRGGPDCRQPQGLPQSWEQPQDPRDPENM